jgi:hypothetical protein
MDKKFQACKTSPVVDLHPAHIREGWDGDRAANYENFTSEECGVGARLIQQCTEAAAADISRFAANSGCRRRTNRGRRKFLYYELQRGFMAQVVTSFDLLRSAHLREYS